MPGRPSRRVVVLELCALALAAGVAVLQIENGDWDLALMGALLALSLVSDVRAVQSASSRVKISGSFLAIVVAAVFLGGTPAAFIGVTTIAVGWLTQRYRRTDLLINLVTYAWFPLIAGIVFHESVQAGDVATGEPTFYLLVLAALRARPGLQLAPDRQLLRLRRGQPTQHQAPSACWARSFPPSSRRPLSESASRPPTSSSGS